MEIFKLSIILIYIGYNYLVSMLERLANRPIPLELMQTNYTLCN